MLFYGSDHLVLTGKDGAHGAASFDGANIIISLNESFVSSDGAQTSFSTVHMVVDPATLGGTYTQMGLQTNPPPTHTIASKGSVIFFPCGPGTM
jgi:hypothetical protein